VTQSAALESNAIPTSAEPAPPALPARELLMQAVYVVARVGVGLTAEELPDEALTDALRIFDKLTLQGPDGAVVFEVEVGRTFGEGVVVAMFDRPLPATVNGDVRIYVMAPDGSRGPYYCYTFHRGLMTTRRERMMRERFIEEVGEEITEIIPEHIVGDDDEDEGPLCHEADCDAPPTLVCVCKVCRHNIEDAFHACEAHRNSPLVFRDHETVTGKNPVWQRPAEAAPTGPAS